MSIEHEKIMVDNELTSNFSKTDDYDGKITGIQIYSNNLGSYYRIIHIGTVEGIKGFVQFDTRAYNYVQRYGKKKAYEHSKEYDRDFDIFKDIENSKKV